MMNFLDQLKEKKILSQKDIDNFKNYINKKYNALDEEKRHIILKNSIIYVINRDLAELQLDKEEKLISSLVDETLLANKEDLCAAKVFEKIISEEKPSDNLLKNLTKWISDKIDIPLNKEIFEGLYPHFNVSHKSLTLDNNPTPSYSTFLSKKTFSWLLWGILAVLSLHSLLSLTLPKSSDYAPVVVEKVSKPVIPAYVLQNYHMPNRNFPHYFYYRDINEENLKSYLSSRNSLLKNEPYYTQLLATAKEFNLNPLLLFAIAGHEQAFVPEDHIHSEAMINNPFNVFGSWQNYNTNLKETSEITARTIFNSLRDLPPLFDPFFWMNRQYAQDPYWWRGVRAIYWTLEKKMLNS